MSGSAAKRHVIESTGAGACFIDYDLDGDVDLYLVNGGMLEAGTSEPPRNALYENDGGDRFREVTEKAGVGDRGWGGGCAVGDYDNDGDSDLYVTNRGANVLYRNEGDGTFSDVTAAAGVGDPRFSLGTSFFDADADGDLDLYVANYLEFDSTDPQVLAWRCRWKGGSVMCGPRGFAGEPDALYLNRGDGTFAAADSGSGVGTDELYGMGVVHGDVDGDGDVDVFVASDSQENQLLVNDGTGRFTDQALLAGVSLSGDGRRQAGMGADLGDVDGDGDPDLFVTNFSDDYHTLYRNDGDLLFTDVSAAAGLDASTRSSLGWGGGFFDFDNDGDLDLFVASGHVYPGVESFDPATSYRQRNLLFSNDGSGTFTEVSRQAGPGFAVPRVARGAAFGDVDDDGDLDVVVVNDGETPSLLRNDGGSAGGWIKLRLRGRRSNRDGIGARVVLVAGGRTQAREVRSSGGYLSSHDPRLHFGLGEAESVERVVVRWPSGLEQQLGPLPGRHLVTIDEERGVVSMVRLQGVGLTAPAEETADQSRAGIVAPAPAAQREESLRRLAVEDLRRLDSQVVTGTQRILAGHFAEGIAAYDAALRSLPPWEVAKSSPDALGFGEPAAYRRFLARLHDNRGVGLMRAGRLAECAPAIEQALALEPGRTKYLHNLGLCHFFGHRFTEAVAALEAAAEGGDPSPGLLYDTGRALASAGRCEEAVETLDAALAVLPRPDSRGRDAEAWYQRGECLTESGRYVAAAESFREALARVPGHQKALYRLALALRRMGEDAAAAHALRLFELRQPADEAVRARKRSGSASAQERLSLARSYLEAGLAPQAIREAEMLLVADGRNAAAAVVLGRAMLALRPPDLDRARQAFSRAVEAAAEMPEALSGFGEVLRRQGDSAAAAELFARALALDPAEVTATIGLVTLSGAGRDAALARLAEVARREPIDPATNRALAAFYVESPARSGHGPREALDLLARTPDHYGEGEEIRLRALALLGEAEAARRLLEMSPFIGPSRRAIFAPLVD